MNKPPENRVTPLLFLRSSVRWLALAGTVLLVVSCAAPPPAQETAEVPEYVWPGPPGPAVIRYVRQFRSEQELDIKKKSSWKDTLLGDTEDERFFYLRTPYAVHADAFGRVLVADPGAAGVTVFDFATRRFQRYGTDGEGRVRQPLGVTTDADGHIYAADGLGQQVLVFDRAGNFVRAIGGEGVFGRPVGLAVDNERRRLYVCDVLKHHVAVYDFEGQAVATIGERGSETGQFNFPLTIALDPVGRLYVLDSMNFRVQILEPDGEPVAVIAKQGDRAGELARPRGIALDADGNVYVSDAAFNNVQLFNAEGHHLMTLGAAGNGPGGFQFPSGLAFDRDGQLYVADQLNKRIQVFQYLGPPDLGEEEEEAADSARPEQESGP